MTINTPSNMRRVTKEEFFAALKRDQRDIMPNHDQPHVTIWEDRSRRVFGRSLPGWKNPGDKKAYFLA
jgi:hypothetical protein